MIELTITQDQWPTEQQADGMVVEWRASEGVTVEQGQVIVEIVIVKTTMEIPSTSQWSNPGDLRIQRQTL